MGSIFDVKKELRWSKLKVGVVVSSALALVFVTVFFSGVLGAAFTRKTELKLQLSDVNGLKPGAPVWLLGVTVGVVKRVELQSTSNAQVTMVLDQHDLKFLRKDARASVLAATLLGDRIVKLNPDRRAPRRSARVRSSTARAARTCSRSWSRAPTPSSASAASARGSTRWCNGSRRGGERRAGFP